MELKGSKKNGVLLMGVRLVREGVTTELEEAKKRKAFLQLNGKAEGWESSAELGREWMATNRRSDVHGQEKFISHFVVCVVHLRALHFR